MEHTSVIPAVVYAVTLARTERVKTTLGVYSLHHIAPELFDGFETRPDGSKLATPEKAIFDMAYFASARSRLFAHIPELELPRGFRERKVSARIAKITDVRRKSMVERRIATILAGGS